MNEIKLEPGPKLDAIISEKVMGWTAAEDCSGQVAWTPPKGPPGTITLSFYEHSLPKYSTDIAAAWEVFQKIHSMVFSKRKAFMEEVQRLVSARANEHSALERDFTMAWPDVFWQITPEIICLAALKAVGYTE